MVDEALARGRAAFQERAWTDCWSTLSDADAETPLPTLALVACTRCRVEEFFEDCKSYLGMTQYETRSWVGWHHHMSLVAMAHLFITLTRRDLGKKRRS